MFLPEPSLGLVGAVLSFLRLIKSCANALMKTLIMINPASLAKDRNSSMYSPRMHGRAANALFASATSLPSTREWDYRFQHEPAPHASRVILYHFMLYCRNVFLSASCFVQTVELLLTKGRPLQDVLAHKKCLHLFDRCRLYGVK